MQVLFGILYLYRTELIATVFRAPQNVSSSRIVLYQIHKRLGYFFNSEIYEKKLQ